MRDAPVQFLYKLPPKPVSCFSAWKQRHICQPPETRPNKSANKLMGIISKQRMISGPFAVAAAALLTVLAGCKGSDEPPDADNDSFADASDCAPQDAQAWQMLTFASRDDDADGFRANTGGQVCAGATLPANRFAVAAAGAEIDCDDANATRWALRHHDAVDADRDGAAVAGAGDLCTGAALPAGYVAVLPAAADRDCNDANAAAWALRHYEAVDADRDGYAVAGAGDLCTGAALPAGYVATLPAAPDLDCDDADATEWRLHSYASRDQDADTYRVNIAGTFCGQAALPAHLFAAATSRTLADCDDADNTRWRHMGTWRDADGDGVGSGAALHQCMGNLAPAGYVLTGYDPLDDPNNVLSASISTLELPIHLLQVPDDVEDDDLP